MRTVTPLCQNWLFYKDESSAPIKISLPHTWNAKDGQDGGNDYFRGRARYVLFFPCPITTPDVRTRTYLQFDAAAMTAEVVLNGKTLAVHDGGFSTFRVELTDCLLPENELTVWVDNRPNSTVYPQSADFTFYGGLYRGVSLITVPAVHFDLGALNTSGPNACAEPGIRVTPTVDLAAHSASVTVEARLDLNRGRTDTPLAVALTVNGETKNIFPDAQGRAAAVFTIENVRLWNGLDDPYLYTASAALYRTNETDGEPLDEISTRFGCRTFSVDPQKGFFLNGRPYQLRGVSLHQDWKGSGNALISEQHEKNMAIIRELGATTLRLAHYQHAQTFYDLCDENGLIVWAEIPYITMHMPGGRANTLSQMRELVTQNYNHPSIVCWGLSNEITAASAVDGDLLENHRLLRDLCRQLDPSRPTAMANVFMLETDSPILSIPDLNSYNLYFGWYLGELNQNEEFLDAFHARYPEMPIGLSEYGADANPLYQSAAPERGDYTESYQALYHEHMAAMIAARPWLWATHVWNLFDFAADGRDEGGKHGENQKGLVTFDRKIKKDAFYLYKAYWSRRPFVHICGSRRVNREETVTEIKVYSNLPAVALLVDGQSFTEISASEAENGHIFRFRVPISGEHTIEARSPSRSAEQGEIGADICSSVALIRKTDAPDPAYIYNREGDISNWFDQESYDPDCYSVQDTLSELGKNAEAGALVQRLMNAASASRGDVAQNVKDNPGLQRMMQRMTLQSLLKQAGEAVTPEQIRAVNLSLQKIRKENK